MSYEKFARHSKVSELSESVIVSHTMSYLHTLRTKGLEAWINEEFPGPRNRSHPLRKRGADIEGIIKPQNGRRMCFEMKTESEYKYITKHIEMLKKYNGPTKRYHHYKDQIEYLEMIESHAGIAMFACSWEQVRDRLIKEGIDKPKGST